MILEIKSHLIRKPKILFLIDGIGALVTAFSLFVILRTFHEYFGMPKVTLNYLSIVAAIFCFYSSSCFFLLKNNWQPFLRIIGVANLLYCCVTMCLMIYYYDRLTILGITYFLTEIIIVCAVAFMELNILKNNRLQ